MENFYDDTEEFTAEQGFMVAATLSSYSGQAAFEVPAEFGSIQFYRKSWSIEDHNHILFERLESRNCTIEDFNYDGLTKLEDKESLFFETI